MAAQTGLSTAQVAKDPCSEFRYSSVHDSCGQLGALAPPPDYVKPQGAGANTSLVALTLPAAKPGS